MLKFLEKILLISLGAMIIYMILQSKTFPSKREDETKVLQERGVSLQKIKVEEPTLYVVTPTYRRVTQRPDITRLANTLRNLDFVYWIVVEDGSRTYPDIEKILERSGVPFRYSFAEYPPEASEYRKKCRGVFNRREALEWLRKETKEGVIYFADDDNSYDLELFNQIRYTKTVSVFPVGLIQQFGISSPVIRNGTVERFHDAFLAGRKFALDMAGFAVNLSLIHDNPEATFPLQMGMLEEGFLKQLGVELEDLEPMASGCTEVLVWHTKTYLSPKPDKKNIKKYEQETNLEKLYDNILL